MGVPHDYIYYGCTRAKDRDCKNIYIREEELIKELLAIINQMEIDKLGMSLKLKTEIERFHKFQTAVLGNHSSVNDNQKLDIRSYAKYLLQEGSITEKRELLFFLKSKLVYKDKKVTMAS